MIELTCIKNKKKRLALHEKKDFESIFLLWFLDLELQFPDFDSYAQFEATRDWLYSIVLIFDVDGGC
ncbi:MAG: hypothetical protein M5F18_09685 [Asgard group archaeon]|nr:hypothetical protein [Asgard group archaeon]